MTSHQRALARKRYGDTLKNISESQVRTVLKHLMEHGSITENEGSDLYHIGRVGARIWDLRHTHDVEITTLRVENIYSSGSHAKWVLEVGA